jgi:hypothetical protein
LVLKVRRASFFVTQKDLVAAAWSPPGEPSFHVPAAFRDFVYGAPKR